MCVCHCESSDFSLISDYFALYKKNFSIFFMQLNALKSTSFQAFQIISDFFFTDALTVCMHVCAICKSVHKVEDKFEYKT